MAQTAALTHSNTFLARCSLEPSTRLHEIVQPEASTVGLSFRAATEDLLAVLGLSITRIEQGIGTEAALQEIRAALLELDGMVARDPGIRMASEDLNHAATAIVAGRKAGSAAPDVRRWRLLREAKTRLRDRLASAQPSERARLSGLH